jgi:hypothetical protein
MAFRGVAPVAVVMTEEVVMGEMTSLLLIPIFVTTFGIATIGMTNRKVYG